jgi:hypothetical protein
VALDLQPIEHLVDLRAAAMDHDRIDADLAQQHDILRKHAGQLLVDHGVAAVFDDEVLPE